jgi:hypothetical protein
MPTDNHLLQYFKNRIEVSTTGDVIQLTVTAEDPELAANIANTWASEAVTAINRAYSGEQPIPEIQAELRNSRERYEEAQTAYESFVQGNQIALLDAQVNELGSMLATVAGERSWQFNFYSQRAQLMDQIVAQAESLQRQLEGQAGSAAAELGDALAVLMARATAFGVNPQTVNIPAGMNASTGSSSSRETLASQDPAAQSNPVIINPGPVINLQLDGLTALIESDADYQRDLDRLIEGAIAEKEEALGNLEQLASEVTGGQGPDLLVETAAKLQLLEERLENETARERVLLGERDLAWNAYQALSQKETELISVSQVNNEVTQAGAAVAPQQPASRGIVRNTVIAGAVGFLLAVLGVVAVEWWRMSGVQEAPPTTPPVVKESSTS